MKAIDLLQELVVKLRLDINTCVDKLEAETGGGYSFRPLKMDLVNMYIGYITTDIYMIKQTIGFKLLLCDYLNKNDLAKQTLREIQVFAKEFFTQKRKKTRLSSAELLHSFFPYTDDNMNAWYNIKQRIEKQKSFLESNNCERVCVVSLKDADDKE